MPVSRPRACRVPLDPERVARLVERGVTGPHIAAALAHNRAVATAVGGLAGALLREDAATSRRDRELAILRIGWNCESEYEVAQHRLMAADAGLSAAEIDATTRPLDGHDWSQTDRLLIRLADQLYVDDGITDELWDQLMAHWSLEQVVELIAVVLGYRMVCGLLNVFGVPLEPGLVGW